MTDDEIQRDVSTREVSTYGAPETTGVVTTRTVPELTDAELSELRRRLEHDPDHQGGNRFGWFLTGFAAALVAIAVAALVFLVVSDADNDGNINVDVPSVDVGG